MMTLGLTADERRAFEEALRSTHTRRISVTVTDLDGFPLASLDRGILLDGQVIVDQDAAITRSATLTYLDPNHALSFDTNSPDDGALYADRMVKIDYSVNVKALGRYVTATIFHGPVTKLDRAADVVSIEAQGKESLASGAIWRTLTLKKGLKIIDAILILMRDRAGEKRFAFPSIATQIPATLSLDRFAEIWATAQGYASSLNRQLFYDGEGVLNLRPYPDTPVYTFRTTTKNVRGDLVTEPRVSYDLGDVKNVIVVNGFGKTTAQAVAPADHALSPERLGPKDAPKYLPEVITDDAIRSVPAATAKAKEVLDDRLREVVEVTFDSLPIPHLDPGDLVQIITDDFTTTFRLKKFTIPLGNEGTPVMPVGYLKKTPLTRKRFRI